MWLVWLDVATNVTGGTISWEVEPSGNAAHLRYVNVPMSTTNHFVNLQVSFFASGEVQFRFGYLHPTSQAEIGWSSGLTDVTHPGNADLSATPPFTVTTPLAHDASAHPTIGATIALDTWPVVSGTFGATIYGFTRFEPGIDLTALGMPGCRQYASTDLFEMWVSQNDLGTTMLTIPNDPSLAGFALTTQGLVQDPGANAFGARTSNGLALQVGI